MMTVDNTLPQFQCMTMALVADVVDVSLGLARMGRGAGARTGGWVLKVVEGADVNGGWLEIDTQGNGFRPESACGEAFAPPLTCRTGKGAESIYRPQVNSSLYRDLFHDRGLCLDKTEVDGSSPSRPTKLDKIKNLYVHLHSGGVIGCSPANLIRHPGPR